MSKFLSLSSTPNHVGVVVSGENLNEKNYQRQAKSTKFLRNVGGCLKPEEDHRNVAFYKKTLLSKHK